MTRSTLYTEPKISTPKGKPWYVWFRYYNETTDTMDLIIRKGGVNYKGTPNTERLAQLNALKKAIKFKLKDQGWNPITNTYPVKTVQQIELERIQNMTFNEALDFGLSKCVAAGKTLLDYRGTINFFKVAAEQSGIDKMPIAQVKRKHIKHILESIRVERKWSNHAFNKHKGYASAVINRLIDWEIIDSNPVSLIKGLPVTETNKYEPITAEEKKIIYEYLYLNHYRYFITLMVTYHTGIRPKEVLALQIKDINEKLGEIIIVPDSVKENSKTKKIRKVPINAHLAVFFREMKLTEYPVDYYVFGNPLLPGSNHQGSKKTGTGAMHPDFFKPAKNKVKRDTTTRLWKTVVMDKLKINKHQYAMKHTGADDKILAGIGIDALQELYGHSSKYMTEKYARKVKEVHRQQIMDLSPAFQPGKKGN
jgi:integrase